MDMSGFVGSAAVCGSDVLLRVPFSAFSQSRPAHQPAKFSKPAHLVLRTFYGHKNRVLKAHVFQHVSNSWSIQCRISSLSATDNAPYIRSSNVIRRELVSINARIARIKREEKLLQVSTGVGAFKDMRPDDVFFQQRLAEGLKLAYEVRDQLLAEIDSVDVISADLLALERRIAIILKEKADFAKNGLDTSRMDKAIRMAEDFKKTLEAELEDASKTGRTSSSRVDNPSFEQHMQGKTRAAKTKTPVAKSPVAKSPVTKTPVAKTPVAKTPVAKSPVAKTPVAKTPVAKTPAPKSPVPGPDGRFEGELTDEEIAAALKEIEADTNNKA